MVYYYVIFLSFSRNCVSAISFFDTSVTFPRRYEYIFICIKLTQYFNNIINNSLCIIGSWYIYSYIYQFIGSRNLVRGVRRRCKYRNFYVLLYYIITLLRSSNNSSVSITSVTFFLLLLRIELYIYNIYNIFDGGITFFCAFALHTFTPGE